VVKDDEVNEGDSARWRVWDEEEFEWPFGMGRKVEDGQGGTRQANASGASLDLENGCQCLEDRTYGIGEAKNI